MPESPIQCWDSTLFLTLLRGRDDAKVRVIRSLLEAHEAGKFRMVISDFTIAEVRSARLQDSPGPAPGDEGTEQREPTVPEHAAVIRELFDSNRLIYWAVTDRVAQYAADIGNKYPSLLPGDCVQIATAALSRASVLLTYDGAGQRRRPRDMLRYDGLIGTPPVAIKEPWDMWPTLGLLETRSPGASATEPELPDVQSPDAAQG